MTSVLAEGVPDWSRSQEPGAAPDYSRLPSLAARLVALAPADRAAEVARFSQEHCFPRLDLPRASGLYLLLRLLFDLPTAFPREDAKVFGGWVHPSVGASPGPFDLSWPLAPLPEAFRFAVEPFAGYFGKGYDAEGEYAYFESRFPLRDPSVLERTELLPVGERR